MSLIDSDIRLSTLPRQVRSAAVAGSFYPADSKELRNVVSSLLEAVKSKDDTPKAIIAPHAGYIYSGSTAARAYASLSNIKQCVKRVILLGPAHRVFVKGMALPSATSFASPLGNVEIDSKAVKQIKHLPFVHMSDAAHAQEHSLEVQIPFLQLTLDQFSLLPLVVGDATPEQVAEVLDLLWGGRETLIVISSDLSHYHNYTDSQRIDSETSNAIEKMQIERIAPQQACGCRPLNGLLHIASQRQMQITRLGLCNSGDTAGSKDRVVGYGAWSLQEKAMFDQKQRQQLLQLARQSIETGLNTHEPLKVDLSDYSELFQEIRASFITLKINGQLRGCIGTTDAVQALVTSVAQNAFKAAFHDPRFKPLSKEEFKHIDLSISVLSAQVPIRFDSETDLINQLVPGKDGLTISGGSRRATFLPAVWESLPDTKSFLGQLKLKAGMKANEQIDKAWRYTSEAFS